ncbi:alpha-hydroxy acid oxidase [Parapedomonas caeni]|jgi:4-hydroxymandelate oxidase
MINSGKAKLDSLPADLLTLEDYARLAQSYVDPPVWAWLQGGSGSLQALEANRNALQRLAVYNRLLVECRHGTTAIRLLGQDVAHPVLLAPIGFQRLVHPEGEVACARGALDTALVVSTLASCPLEDIAGAAAGPLWFQLYFQPERHQTLALVRRAEAAGYQALVVTLDTPVKPQGVAAQKAGFALPESVSSVNVADFAPTSPVRLTRADSFIFQGVMAYAPQLGDIDWLRGQTRLPILAKGVSHPDDARMLIGAGLDGIIVSNHGGRSLEAAPAAIDALPAVREALGRDATILMDGGIRTGSDVLKAIALGANAVMIGRPQLHALAVAGSLGVAHMLKLLREELEIAMALSGCPTIKAITPACLFRAEGVPC